MEMRQKKSLNLFVQIRRLLLRPWREKVSIIRLFFKRLWNILIPFVPLYIRLPYGGWWIAINDVCSDEIFVGIFEVPERRFVERFLKDGMIVLDIGAHHGFYTILASKKAGPSGRVIAFEPSPRERQRLLMHLKFNQCNNVKVEPFALSSQNGEAAFYIVDGRDTGCNSLCPPAVSEPTKVISVNIITLDNYLEKEMIHHIDFVKIDAEGAELEVLKGSKRFINQRPRPVILCEVDDHRTRAWGYSASMIIEILESYGFRWFGIGKEGQLLPIEKRNSYNLVALPEEFVDSIL
jgi:FkbM family methyltransferase